MIVLVGDMDTAKLLFELGAKEIINEPDNNFRPPGSYAELHDRKFPLCDFYKMYVFVD